MYELVEDYLSEELYIQEISISSITVENNKVYVEYSKWIYDSEDFENFKIEINLQDILAFIYSKTCKKDKS